ncbi:MAG TPA: molybdenum cofactor biosynthesis protein MoaE [Candidatus Bathyarchaeia archaeon]|nr:molybdenum cofactor biosynthesis protein MoaE [Candidatus Bathyarchaeia archaeon]
MHPVGLHRRGEVDLTQIIESFSKHPQSRRAGAVASFIGVVREDPVQEESGKVSHLEYEAYEEVALKRLEEIRQSMLSRPGIVEVSIHHIIDKLGVGEASLFVAVLGGHRQEVFPVLAETVERVKREVPIWKKEYTSKGAYWISTGHTQDKS